MNCRAKIKTTKTQQVQASQGTVRALSQRKQYDHADNKSCMVVTAGGSKEVNRDVVIPDFAFICCGPNVHVLHPQDTSTNIIKHVQQQQSKF